MLKRYVFGLVIVLAVTLAVLLLISRLRPEFTRTLGELLPFWPSSESNGSVDIHKVSREDGVYEVFQGESYLGSFLTQKAAVEFASGYGQTLVKRKSTGRIVWDDLPSFKLYDGGDGAEEYASFRQAAAAAKMKENAYIVYRKNDALLWNSLEIPPESVRIEGVPHISQNPELPRGCEVTSLTMLMRYAGIDIDKMTLADEIVKDPTPFSIENGRTVFGNPNIGFVGSITDRGKPGYGVYHGPIADLSRQYLGNDAIDLTGSEFEHLIYFLMKSRPVWIITNVTYKPIGESSFNTWLTPSGEVRVTALEHSVLVIGYDSQYIYFNDPLKEAGGSFAPRDEFIGAWEQMGRQAVSYCPSSGAAAD